MLKCIIVDDEASAIRVLKKHIQAVNCLQLVHATTNPSEAVSIITQQQIPLAFLDIHMPNITGLALAEALRGQCRVIFTTGHSQFVSDVLDLDVGVIDYLLKPIPLGRFARAVERAIKLLLPANAQQAELALLQAGGPYSLENDYVFVRTAPKGDMLRVMLAHIDYLEADKKHVNIYHLGQKTIAMSSMRAIEEKLPAKYFMRVQKSFIVAMDKVAKVEGNRVVLQNTTAEINLGEAYKAQFMEAMRDKLL